MKTELRVERPDRVVTWEGDLPLVPEGQLISLPEVAATRIVSSLIHISRDGSAKQILMGR